MVMKKCRCRIPTDPTVRPSPNRSRPGEIDPSPDST
jgi:hypothetical protein